MSNGLRQLKGLLWKIACHLMFWSGVGPLLAWSLRRGQRSGWTILTYHRIGEPQDDGGPDQVSPARFRQQLRYLRRRYEVVTVGQALQRINAGDRVARPLLSITFDDGYRDNVSDALPLLTAESCPCTLFVTVEAARDRLPPWPHRLTHGIEQLVDAPLRKRHRLHGTEQHSRVERNAVMTDR
ncbi:MAG TPA: polysaccharide deacetylase family protein, partial [Candidatus Polarisedimenticolia bacterium]|nr:polysaccharide deacetylase family protein [Candidatus Polarisedimenticolia bacterium]